MADPSPRDTIADDFLEQIIAYGEAHVGSDCNGALEHERDGFLDDVFPLGFGSEEGGGECDRDKSTTVVDLASLCPMFGRVQDHQICANAPLQHFDGQPIPSTVAAAQNPPAPRPKARAKRGQATDPHSIAERLRRERIAERMRAILDLVPCANKTDRAAMLDEITDYVKFLRLQVKVLSMSRFGRTGDVTQLERDTSLPSNACPAIEEAGSQQIWDKWSTADMERQVVKLMEEDVGAAMQFLQSKALCIMPISLAAALFRNPQQSEFPTLIKPEPDSPS